MASADDNYGKLQLIDPDDDSDDGETASGVVPGIKHAVTTEGHEPKLENIGISSRTPVTKTFRGPEARKLWTFFMDELQEVKVEISISVEKGKEWITLSSCDHMLLITANQRVENLLSSIQCEETMSISKSPCEINDLIKSQHLKLLLCENENRQLCIYFQDPSEYHKLQTLLKPNSSTRRNRTFGNVYTFSSAAQQEPDLYESKLEWRSKDAFDNPSVGDNIVLSTYLGENANVKMEIVLNGINTKIYQGSIVKARVGAIVNAANERLDNCSGVADVIAKAAGYKMEDDCREKMKNWKRIKVSENVVTCAGNLPCRWIIHAVGPRWDDYFYKEKALEDLYKTVFNVLKTASESHMQSVVMPPISSGIFGVPTQACAAMYIKALLDFSEQYKKPKIEEFHLIDNKADMLDFIHREYEESKKKGKEYLEPRNVLERLHIRPTKTAWTNNNYSKMNNNFNRNPRGAEASKKNSSSWSQSVSDIPNRILKEIGPGEFTVEGMLKVYISTESILNLKDIDVLVCAEGREAAVSRRIAKAILDKVSKKQKEKIEKLLSCTKHFTNVLQTEFGVDSYSMIFFAIIKRFGDNQPRHDDLTLMKNTMTNVLEKANKRKNSRHKSPLSVAMPLLGTGSTKNTNYLQEFADVTCSCIIDFRKHIKDYTRLRTIHLVNYDKNATEALVRAFKSRLLYQTVEQTTPKLLFESDDDDEAETSWEGAYSYSGQPGASVNVDLNYDNVEKNKDSSVNCVVC